MTPEGQAWIATNFRTLPDKCVVEFTRHMEAWVNNRAHYLDANMKFDGDWGDAVACAYQDFVVMILKYYMRSRMNLKEAQ